MFSQTREGRKQKGRTGGSVRRQGGLEIQLVGRIGSLRMDRLGRPSREVSLEEGGPARPYFSSSDPTQGRLGSTPMLWNPLCAVRSNPTRKPTERGEIGSVSAFRDNELVNGLPM